MRREMRRSSAQMNDIQRNSLQGTYHRETYNSHRKQYQSTSSNYYMYTANAVARDYLEEEAPKKQVQKKKSEKRQRAIAQQISTLVVVFLLSMMLVVQYAYIQNLGYEVSQSKTELKKVQEQNEKIKKEIASLGELQNVEAVAINQMGMHKPQNWEIIYLPRTVQPSEEVTEERKTTKQFEEILGTMMQ